MPAKSTRPATPGRPAARKPTRPTSATRAAAEKQRRAVELRTTGMSFDRIAEELHYRDRSSAHKAYLAGLAQLPALEDRTTMLQVETARLDALQAAVWSMAMAGESEAVRDVLAIMSRRARLLGLDAPTKTEHKVTSELDAEIEGMLADMAKLATGQPG